MITKDFLLCTSSSSTHSAFAHSGRKAFVDFFSKINKPKAILDKVTSPLVSITAEGDLVILTFVDDHKDPKDPTKTYTTTWFDMFRIENGKIAEHWDCMTKPS